MSAAVERVLIAGGGVAGLETLLALRALAGDRVAITLVAPDRKFRNQSMSAQQPFVRKRPRGVRLKDVAAEFDVRLVSCDLDRVDPQRSVAVTTDRKRLRYDKLVVALGARPKQWISRSPVYRAASPALSYCCDRASPDYRLLLHRLDRGAIRKVAFVRPADPCWPLPLYDLALLTAARAANRGSGIELSLVTPEQEPLGIFGHRASVAVRGMLAHAGVALHPASYGDPGSSGWLEISPGDRAIEVDRIVTQPCLVGPHLHGLPCDPDGFIAVDRHGRVPELPGILAAGDATTFPVKEGGLAAQQADVVAETIAASVGIELDPQPFRPVLRGLLLTARGPRYLRADISTGAASDSTISRAPLWWPPNKLAGRYLAPYLSRQVGEATDVMPDQGGVPADAELDQPELTDVVRRSPA